MDWIAILQAHLGLISFTIVCVLLTAYLAYAMVFPERL